MANSQSRKNGARTGLQHRPPAARPAKPASAENKPRTARAERVHARAYEIYSQRLAAGAPGNQLSDWLQAESELRREED